MIQLKYVLNLYLYIRSFIWGILWSILDLSGKDLTNKLSKQREKEKQSLINDFESKDADARLATTDMQKYGITNWWSSHQQNLKNQETDRYKEQMEDEEKNN